MSFFRPFSAVYQFAAAAVSLLAMPIVQPIEDLGGWSEPRRRPRRRPQRRKLRSNRLHISRRVRRRHRRKAA